MSCKHNKPCGCGDQPLKTPGPCNETEPCNREPCSELFCEDCIIHCQPDISVTISGNTLTISQGMRWHDILQQIMCFIMAPNCFGIIAHGLQLLQKTSGSITIKWIGDPATAYDITWQEGQNIYTDTVIAVSTYTIVNLIPDTVYTVKIITNGSQCETVTMTIKTLP